MEGSSQSALRQTGHREALVFSWDTLTSTDVTARLLPEMFEWSCLVEVVLKRWRKKMSLLSLRGARKKNQEPIDLLATLS